MLSPFAPGAEIENCLFGARGVNGSAIVRRRRVGLSLLKQEKDVYALQIVVYFAGRKLIGVQVRRKTQLNVV